MPTATFLQLRDHLLGLHQSLLQFERIRADNNSEFAIRMDSTSSLHGSELKDQDRRGGEERDSSRGQVIIIFSLCHFEQSGATPRNLAVCRPTLSEPLS